MYIIKLSVALWLSAFLLFMDHQLRSDRIIRDSPINFRPEIKNAQELQHDVIVINVEVPVRVYKGERFINTLGIEDFDIFEDGIPQKIEAVYLIRKAKIKREEAISLPPILRPKVENRLFVLMFEMDNYLPELNGVLESFFNQLLQPLDTVWIITPKNNIKLKKDALSKLPREKIIEQLKGKLKKDILQAYIPLRSLLEDVRMMTVFMDDAGSDAGTFGRSRDMLIEQIINWKTIDERQFEVLADLLKKEVGTKSVFFFYQKEEILLPGVDPVLSNNALRREFFDHDRIRRAFADASATFHFLYLTKTNANALDVSYRNRAQFGVVELGGGGFFDAFNEIAKTTGGISESTANPKAAFEKAIEASDNYYLLYYKPVKYKPDGRFKNIEVKVKKKGYRVLYRAGYVER